jgi:hypothetical protein
MGAASRPSIPVADKGAAAIPSIHRATLLQEKHRA